MKPGEGTAAESQKLLSSGVANDDDQSVTSEDGERKLTQAEKLQVAELEQKIAEISVREDERILRLSEVEELFDSRIEEIKELIEGKQGEIDELSAELEVLENPKPDPPSAPGPDGLLFIMGDRFNLVASIVIIANLFTMVQEALDKSKEETYFYLDQSFMIFYIFEITCKAILLQKTMLFGPPAIVWWNWLDSIIVGSGCLDMYLQPLLMAVGLMSSGGSGLKALSFLRILRLLRILKIIGVFLKTDTSWSQGESFQGFIMGVIGFNSVVMGLEIEIPAFPGWFAVEQMLLVIFFFELMLRLKIFGLTFFVHPQDIVWNNLDFVIVMGGVVDQWMMPAIAMVKQIMGHPSHGKGNLGQIMMLLRMARLLRILRLVRLVKNIPPLFTLIVGIAQAMQGMMWVIVLTIVVLYAFSLLGVKLIGNGLLLTGDPNDPKNKYAMTAFPNVFDSFFVLFKAMNGDWGALEPVFDVLPAMKVIIVLYTVMSTWGILSILTAVVSDNMINSSEEQREEREHEEEEEREANKERRLRAVFHAIDRDSGGTLTKTEFEELLKQPDLRDELCDASGLAHDDLKALFQSLSTHPDDHPESVIEEENFVEGLKKEGRLVTERSIMRLEDRICRIEAELRNWAKFALKPSLEDPDCEINGEVREFVSNQARSKQEDQVERRLSSDELAGRSISFKAP